MAESGAWWKTGADKTLRNLIAQTSSTWQDYCWEFKETEENVIGIWIIENSSYAVIESLTTPLPAIAWKIVIEFNELHGLAKISMQNDGDAKEAFYYVPINLFILRQNLALFSGLECSARSQFTAASSS